MAKVTASQSSITLRRLGDLLHREKRILEELEALRQEITHEMSVLGMSTVGGGERTLQKLFTPKQEAVLAGLRQGKSNKEIASALNLSENTVKSHVSALLRKFGVKRRSDLRF